MLVCRAAAATLPLDPVGGLYMVMSIFVWSNLACIEATLGRAGLLFVMTMCLSVRPIGIELVDNANDLLLLVGDDGVFGIDSSWTKKGIK